MATQRVVLHWFRKGLRLHDNPALMTHLRAVAHEASGRCAADVLYPVFIIDPWFADESKVCANRYSFLLQCLTDLDVSLRALGSRLFVLRGKPADVLPAALEKWRVTHLTFEKDIEPYALIRDQAITEGAQARGVVVSAVHGHTLWEPERLLAKARGSMPVAYQSFVKLAESCGAPPKPIPAPVAGELPPASRCTPADTELLIPTLEELGYRLDGVTTPFRGGETEALARLQRYMARVDWVCAFEKPDTSPNALSPSTTVLSPYMKFGALSARTFWAALQSVYAGRKHASPPVSLDGQLLWREFFYAQAFAVPNFDRMVGNPVCTQIAWRHNPALLAAWTEGRTGYPWIDAVMKQLALEGWIHHLARHAVACFLTRGDLYLSWEAGAKVFDRLLLDADFALNNGNWMWLSASAYFYQFYRVYSPVAFPKKTDPNGDYIRKYLPQFRTLPKEYIYEPWKAPLSVQRAHGVIVGENYPARIVIHEDVHKGNIDAHSRAYAAKKAGTPLVAEAGATGMGVTQTGSHPAAAAAFVPVPAAAASSSSSSSSSAPPVRTLDAFMTRRGGAATAAVTVDAAPRKRARVAPRE